MDVVRALDGYEIPTSRCWISVRCVLPRSATSCSVVSNLTSGLPVLVAKHLPLGLSIRMLKRSSADTEEHPFFVKARPESLTPENLVTRDAVWPDCDAMDMPSVSDYEPLFHLRVSCEPGTGRVGLRADINHVLCDGRTAFDLLAMFCNVALFGEDKTVPPCTKLTEFGHRDHFTDAVHDAVDALEKEGRIPESWTHIPRGKGRLIAGFPEPAVYVNTTYRYAYSPITQYCSRMGRDKGFSVQALLMAAKTRAVREYCGLPDSQALAVYTPTDTRVLPWATEVNRSTSPFFCHAGCNVPVVCGTGSAEDDVRCCAEAMHACATGMDPCLQVMRSARCVDPKTLAFSPDTATPNTTEDYLVAASSLGDVTRSFPEGCVESGSDVWLGCTYACSTSFFSLNIYGYHAGDVMSILSMTPSTLDPRFAQVLHKNLDEIFINVAGSHALP